MKTEVVQLFSVVGMVSGLVGAVIALLTASIDFTEGFVGGAIIGIVGFIAIALILGNKHKHPRRKG